MEVLLWRWSNGVQWTSLALIGLFFAILARSFPFLELRWWVRAWALNLLAITLSLYYWVMHPEAPLHRHLVGGLYMASKLAFALLALHAGSLLRNPGQRPLRLGRFAPLVLGYGLLGAPLLPRLEALGFVHQAVMGSLLTWGGARLLRSARGAGQSWLASGFLVRGVLAGVESLAYGSTLAPEGAVAAPVAGAVRTFLSSHSFVDTCAEWMLALAFLLALSDRVQAELRETNRVLLETQEDLRRLADRDPLTALDNRRALPDLLRAVQPRGALLLFFDLDGFKAINDRYGHRVGDECLRRFAGALGESFRPEDALLRYAGDEFLVVASGLDRAGAEDRLARLRSRLLEPPGGAPEIRFSVGAAVLPPGGRPEEALEAADRDMYAAKRVRSSS